MKSDWQALVISYIYVFAVIFAAEALRAWRKYSTDFTRKFVHIGVGMWIIGTVQLFSSRYIAIIPPLSFVILNYIFYRRETFKAMEAREEGNLGTVYFPISFAVLILFLWPHRDLLVASLMPMTWGDAIAALVGRRYGKHRFQVLGCSRSREGSLAMFLVSWLTVAVALSAFSTRGWASSLLYGLPAAAFATFVEAITPWHVDNLTVPLASALLLSILPR